MEGNRKRWDTLKRDRMERIREAIPLVKMGKIVEASNAVKLLETVIKPYDKVTIEGDNQKQADFLADCLCKVDREQVHHLHMVQSAISLPSHLAGPIPSFMLTTLLFLKQ